MSEHSAEKGLLEQSDVRRISKGPCMCSPKRRTLVWIGDFIYCSNCGPDAGWWNR